jgi:AraC-like DNA-binding protein
LLAARYGFADQAHLVREFRELTGLTPSGLARVGSDADFLQDALACHLGISKPPAAKHPEAVNGRSRPS